MTPAKNQNEWTDERFVCRTCAVEFTTAADADTHIATTGHTLSRIVHRHYMLHDGTPVTQCESIKFYDVGSGVSSDRQTTEAREKAMEDNNAAPSSPPPASTFSDLASNFYRFPTPPPTAQQLAVSEAIKREGLTIYDAPVQAMPTEQRWSEYNVPLCPECGCKAVHISAESWKDRSRICQCSGIETATGIQQHTWVINEQGVEI